MTNQELEILLDELNMLTKAAEFHTQKLDELDIKIQEIQKKLRLEINLFKVKF